MAHDDLRDFAEGTFTFNGATRVVYRKGSGPAVIVMAEVPGITPKVADFARRVVDSGCTAVMPVLFGDPGRDPVGVSGVAYTVRTVAALCVSREFAAFAANSTAPVSAWLRALATEEFDRCGGLGVGAVGMCFTGGFALGMLLNDKVKAPVLSQPSLPMGVSARARRALQLSPADLALVKQRVRADDVCVLGLRFTHDPVSPGDRFARLREELGDAFIGVEIDSSPDNEHGHSRMAHSVLTESLRDEPGQPTHDALNQVLDFFRERLIPA
jgi:dienelactone hydrolase